MICEILVSFLDSYKDYLLYFIVINGLYFGIIVSKLIISTMSGKHQRTPSIEGLIYLITTIFALKLPQFEVHIIVFQGIYIALYYAYFYGKIVSQLMRDLKIKTF